MKLYTYTYQGKTYFAAAHSLSKALAHFTSVLGFQPKVVHEEAIR